MRRHAVLLGLVLTGACACTPAPAADPAPVIPTVPLPSTSAAAATTAPPVLPGSCAQLIPGNQLDASLGVAVSGTVDVVVGQAQADIGRTGRITCRYGVPVAGTYPVEVSLTSYGTPAQAADRVTATVAAAERQGVGSQQVEAGGADGLFVPYPSGSTVVASSGIYSVAVTLAPPAAGQPLGDAASRAGAVAGIVLAGAGV